MQKMSENMDEVEEMETEMSPGVLLWLAWGVSLNMILVAK
jgi:hypothetical protein